ncbi:MAG: hypothetical protein IJR91_02380 [Ruminococcus sp.]|nr:hypothetical protein [Ruminococcus sp.]
MPNDVIRKNMLLAGVSISELADKLGLTDVETCDLLNTNMGTMQTYKVSYAVAEIVKERK